LRAWSNAWPNRLSVISVRGLEHRYAGTPVLSVPQWEVGRGERWLLLGASGSGKTTLLHVLAGLISPSAGEVTVDGANLNRLSNTERDRWRGANVGIVLQALHLFAHLTVRDNLRLAQYLGHAPQDDARVDEALDALGVRDKHARRPAQLSQGERQRVAVARAVVNRPKLLLADEPTASLDDAAAARAVELLIAQAARHGATLLVATHDARVKPFFEKKLELGE
jgi:putative ABC transport system ATP-binding protein